MSSQQQPLFGKLIYRHDLTSDLAIIRIQPADGGPVPDFKPGQFITLGLKLDSEDNADRRSGGSTATSTTSSSKITNRAYSIASPPDENRYFELYIKWSAEPVPGKFTTALFSMEKGGELYWRKPAGVFTIEDKRANGTPDDRTLVLIASGTGLAPFVSYVLHLKKIGSKRKVALLHGARNAKELGYRDLFERLAKEDPAHFIYLPTISRPNDPGSEGWKGHVGRVESLLVPKGGVSDLDNALGVRVTPDNSFIHICGYSGTVDNVISILQPLGFVSNRSKRKDGSFDIKVEIYG